MSHALLTRSTNIACTSIRDHNDLGLFRCSVWLYLWRQGTTLKEKDREREREREGKEREKEREEKQREKREKERELLIILFPSRFWLCERITYRSVYTGIKICSAA